jgi:hypothetical protein
MARATAEEVDLHNRIIARDDTAFSQLCVKYLESTSKKLIKYYRKIHMNDDSLIKEVVVDSFISYRDNPKKFDPEKRTLEKFLVMDAEGDLKNVLDKRKRQGGRLVSLAEFSEAGEQSRELEIKAESNDEPDQILINKQSAEYLRSRLTELFESPADREITDLILSGERDTTVYAQVLGITHLDFCKQQEEVKRIKDRINKILKRGQ